METLMATLSYLISNFFAFLNKIFNREIQNKSKTSNNAKHEIRKIRSFSISNYFVITLSHLSAPIPLFHVCVMPVLFALGSSLR
uniref:Uncharacterized protein n=2 Tax=Kuenenia stuttgartiensis TaxID=174633 RepID=Q1Q0U5_KUEST|nr:unknown protein [Candidatus Kuenenia stuttgartiensis]